ncbi:IlvD/Edd family dehydratase [Phaeobacter gallaeciensis]|uniref:Dihydroxy-acid dehydratase IlvD n=1 Tax=Phaeobacter gallaeciensis TaxID=60890 RepID=A0AAC9ZC72_9RHOB|nr:IlvD/Edd family dehydratase [Phaeobacter gallaeciensis]AHD10487.1 Dihydroxyacid dehydratase/phosphogluconate dehydratase [Phaeobacter gallaeciensis DSM 26640]ATE93750.1 dihydroxy-acid dehydratase IlvD [Phaeobacter gallaeciensis]ATE96429.1 dihydroxy-acid dehydratase IlvD [Phaeobacter gallaeciensis]ATF02414.1 dihydroxy-acid dehydratase IlvD [Phaeobacter gallaeciensis]ATF06794.1 dihydroxy-acid dehydratase IlvD [Phaeobacter gallaeciensis]
MTKDRRNRAWYGKLDKDGFIHRSWMKNQGFPDHAFDGRPIIGICNTWSELTPCNSGLRDLAEGVKRGVWEAGGFPVEFPVMSLGETQMKPTAMLFRNLLAMDVEESIRAYGIDGVVLLGGCDKTTPGQLMGAASVNLPAIVVSSGPMLNGKWQGKDIGSGTDVWKFSEAVRAGEMTLQDFMAAESGMSRSKGVCMTMGTASTMASLVEAMGMSLPTNAALPAVDARRMALAHLTGKRIVEMVEEDIKPSDVLTRDAFINAIMANAAVGGSTNAVVHLLALAGRVGVELTLDDFGLGSEIPLLVNCMPSGKYLMEDFCYAGGVPVVLKHLANEGHLRSNTTVLGGDITAYAEGAECFNDDVIKSFDNPVKPAAGLRVLRGNLAPNGAIVKPSAATDHLLEHEGVAHVFETIEDMKANIDRDDLPVTKDSILVLKGVGPKGYPGMPEVGNMPIPRKLVREGVRDMIRISDGRMSGTAFGTVILHVSPESQAGGPLGLVQSGDRIRVSAQNGTLDLLVSEDELTARREAWLPEPPHYTRGYAKLYIDSVLQAEQGADLDFLVGKDTRPVTRESH